MCHFHIDPDLRRDAATCLDSCICLITTNLLQPTLPPPPLVPSALPPRRRPCIPLGALASLVACWRRPLATSGRCVLDVYRGSGGRGSVLWPPFAAFQPTTTTGHSATANTKPCCPRVYRASDRSLQEIKVKQSEPSSQRKLPFVLLLPPPPECSVALLYLSNSRPNNCTSYSTTVSAKLLH